MDREEKPRKKSRRRKRFVKPADRGTAPQKDRKPTQSKATTGPTSKTAWVENAQWYDNLVGDEGSEFHRHVVLPGLLKLLGVGQKQKSALQGRHILDLCCGQGVLCRLLNKHGASVTGVDASAPLIDLAHQRGPAEVRYLVADAAGLFRKASRRTDPATDKSNPAARHAAPLPASFDAVTCVLALQDLADLDATFATASMALKTGGFFLAVIMHPCFRAPKHTHWGWDDDAGVQFRRIDRYLTPFDAPIQTHPGSKPDAKTTTHHRPLQDYINSLARQGLLTDALEEWPSHKHSDSGPRAPAENTARQEIPMFLALRAIKN